MMCSLSAVRQLTFQLKRFIVFQFKTITVTFYHPPVAGWISNQDSKNMMIIANKITSTFKLVKNTSCLQYMCRLQVAVTSSAYITRIFTDHAFTAPHLSPPSPQHWTLGTHCFSAQCSNNDLVLGRRQRCDEQSLCIKALTWPWDLLFLVQIHNLKLRILKLSEPDCDLQCKYEFGFMSHL